MHNFPETDDEAIVIRRMNRALRGINTRLRRRIKHAQDHSDELFIELCNTDIAAAHAMGELWGSGRFDCGPQDYEYMVERCLVALREYDERHTNSVSSAE